MGTLKELCSDGHTVLVSIHQPRSSVFAMFDDLILMAGAPSGGRRGGDVKQGQWDGSARRGRERGHQPPVPGPSAD